MDTTDRILAVVFCALFFTLGLLIGRSARQEPVPPPPVLASWEARVEALEKRADEALKIRCMRVEAGRLDMMIIPVENVGRKP